MNTYVSLPLSNWGGWGPVPISSAPQPIVPGFTTTLGKFENCVIQGNYAYVPSFGSDSTGTIGLSLCIYNIGDRNRPILTGYLTTGSVVWTTGPSFLNSCYNVAVWGKYCYVASAGSSVIYVVDVSNPSTPTNVGRLLISSTPGAIYGVAYQNGYCYFATQNTGLVVVSVSNPLLPVQTFQEAGGAKSFGVEVQGSILYTTQYSTASPYTIRQIKTWSLANPAVPSFIQSFQVTTPGEALGVTVSGVTAFVSVIASGVNSINLIDITNPAAMANLSQITPLNTFNSAFVGQAQNNYLFIPSGSNATYGGSLECWDISTRTAPKRLSFYEDQIPTSIFGGVAVQNGFCFIGNYGIGTGSSSQLTGFTTPYRPILTYSGNVWP